MLIPFSTTLPDLVGNGECVGSPVAVSGRSYYGFPAVVYNSGVSAINKNQWFDVYKPRDFLVCKLRNTVITAIGKCVASEKMGFIEEFNVGGASSIPTGLLEHDLSKTEHGWYADDSRIEHIKGLSVPFCHYGLNAFGHFILDGLLQIFLFKDEIFSGQAKLVRWPFAEAWSNAFLEACGITHEHTIVLNQPVAHLETALLSSALAGHGVYFPTSLSKPFFSWLKSLFQVDLRRPTRRLYVQRSETSSRPLMQDHEIESLCNRFGIETISPSKMSLAEQIGAFLSSDLIVSPFGSTLTLAPLLKGKRTVIELLPSYVDDVWFQRQSIIHDLDYQSISLDTSAEGVTSVDLDVLDQVLRLVT